MVVPRISYRGVPFPENVDLLWKSFMSAKSPWTHYYALGYSFIAESKSSVGYDAIYGMKSIIQIYLSENLNKMKRRCNCEELKKSSESPQVVLGRANIPQGNSMLTPKLSRSLFSGVSESVALQGLWPVARHRLYKMNLLSSSWMRQAFGLFLAVLSDQA